jgi:Uncharacterized protein conserved in bacteria
MVLLHSMKTMTELYDVQQLLKKFGIYIHLGKRIYDIELMKMELKNIYDAGLLDKDEYLVADLILRREHRLESELQDDLG